MPLTEVQHFECSNAIKICDGITFDFYMGVLQLFQFMKYPMNPIQPLDHLGRTRLEWDNREAGASTPTGLST